MAKCKLTRGIQDFETVEGLVVPVIKNIKDKSILDIGKDLTLLSRKAQHKKLTPADMEGGCFTISSLGGIGGTYFTPLINPPEVAILGISRFFREPCVIDGNIVTSPHYKYVGEWMKGAIDLYKKKN